MPMMRMASVLLAAVFVACEHAGCEQRQVLSQKTSPDGAWVATTYENICPRNAPAFMTTVTKTVEITRPDEGAQPAPSAGMVFAMDAHSVGVLAVKWTGPRDLEVTVPNDAWAAKQDV